MKKRAGRARNHTGSIGYFKSRECWRIRYTVYDPISGKGIQKAEYFKTKEEAEQALFSRVHAVADESYTEPNKRKLSEWIAEYNAEFAKKREPGTVETYRVLLEKHILPALGDIRLCDLNRERIQRLVNGLAASGKAAKTIKTTIAPLSKALHLAKQYGYIRENFAEDLQYPEDTAKEKPALTDEEADRLEAITEGSPIGDMIFIARRTGLRISEVLGMAWKNVDMAKQRMTVYQLATGKTPYLKAPKNHKTRIVPLNDDVIERLKRIKAEQRKARLAAGSAWCNALDLVFTSTIGEPFKSFQMQAAFRAARKKAGFGEDVSFHALRRTFATYCNRKGVPDKAFIAMIGHHDIRFTVDKYVRNTEDMQRETLPLLQDIGKKKDAG